MNYLGVLYHEGNMGVELDVVQGAKWFLKAAEAGNPTGMQNYIQCLIDGTGVARNAAEVARWRGKLRDAEEAVAAMSLKLKRSYGGGR